MLVAAPALAASSFRLMPGATQRYCAHGFRYRSLKGPTMNAIVVARKAPDWSRLKALVLDSVSSPITRRVTISA